MLTSTNTKNSLSHLSFGFRIIFHLKHQVSFILSNTESRVKMKAITVNFFLILTSFVACDRISNYKQVGQAFIQQYYTLFDNVLLRSGVKDLYDGNDSILIIGTDIFYGAEKIMERLNMVSPVVQRNVTSADCQPTNDAGVIVNVYGRILFTDSVGNWTPHFIEMFVLKPRVTSYFIQNQHFRSTIVTNSTNNNNTDSLRFV